MIQRQYESDATDSELNSLVQHIQLFLGWQDDKFEEFYSRHVGLSPIQLKARAIELGLPQVGSYHSKAGFVVAMMDFIDQLTPQKIKDLQTALTTAQRVNDKLTHPAPVALSMDAERNVVTLSNLTEVRMSQDNRGMHHGEGHHHGLFANHIQPLPDPSAKALGPNQQRLLKQLQGP